MLNIFDKGFREKLDQIKVNQLSAEIKNLKTKIKEENCLGHWSNSSFEEKRDFYKSKITYYSELLKQCNRSLQLDKEILLTLPEDLKQYINFEWEKQVQQKIPILDKLIALATEISETGNTTKEMMFRWLEVELNSDCIKGFDFADYLTPVNIYIVSSQSPELDSLSASLALFAQLKSLQAQFLSIMTRIRRKRRDLRQSYRSIIRFLFKNMDDETDEDNVLKTEVSKTFFHSVIFSYEKKRNNRAIICNT
jgi:hypothetical protein